MPVGEHRERGPNHLILGTHDADWFQNAVLPRRGRLCPLHIARQAMSLRMILTYFSDYFVESCQALTQAPAHVIPPAYLPHTTGTVRGMHSICSFPIETANQDLIATTFYVFTLGLAPCPSP